MDSTSRGVRQRIRWSTKGSKPHPRIHFDLTSIPSSEVHDKGKRSSAPQNQCCPRGVCSSTRDPSPKISTTYTTPTCCHPCSRSNISPSPPILQVEEEKEVEQEEEGFVDLTESTDNYEVFNQPSPPQDVPEDMGIQRKPQRSLQELLKSQPGRGEAGKPSQPKLPSPPPKSPPRAPQPPPPSKTEQVGPKRRREPKGKEAMEIGTSMGV